AVEILIGLIHIGFGAVSLSSLASPSIFRPISAIGGYPFWGGIFFISSGSLCVAAANRPTHPLVRNLSNRAFMPYQVIRGREVTDEPNPPPPTYNLVTKSQ
ncbi:hypothetical protein E2320_020681, partial [Naja naja]